MLGVFSNTTIRITILSRLSRLPPLSGRKTKTGTGIFLGSLMGLQLKREGGRRYSDRSRRAVFLCHRPAAPVVLSEITQIGRSGVKLARGLPSPMPVSRRYEEMELNVSSLRVDCIVSAVNGVSREKSAQAVRSQTVFCERALLRKSPYHLSGRCGKHPGLWKICV
jgi:RNA-binding protein YlmH